MVEGRGMLRVLSGACTEVEVMGFVGNAIGADCPWRVCGGLVGGGIEGQIHCPWLGGWVRGLYCLAGSWQVYCLGPH